MMSIRLLIGTIAFGLTAPTLVEAQTVGRTSKPQEWLAAPADPLSYHRRSNEASQLLDKQKNAEAEALLASLVVEYPLSGSNWGRLAIAHRRQGKHAAAIQAYKKVMELQGEGLPYNALYNIAASQAAMGDREAALATLERLVFKEAYIRRPSLLDDKNFANLLSDPRFLRIAGREDISKLDHNQGWRRDINYMVEELKRVVPDYRHQPFPSEFDMAHRQLLKEVPRLADEEIFMRMGRMLNILDLGHTNFWPMWGAKKLKFDTLPVAFYAFPEASLLREVWQAMKNWLEHKF